MYDLSHEPERYRSIGLKKPPGHPYPEWTKHAGEHDGKPSVEVSDTLGLSKTTEARPSMAPT